MFIFSAEFIFSIIQMSAQAEKSAEPSKQAGTTHSPEPRSTAIPALQFADNRSDATAIRNLQETAGNSSGTRQLLAYQSMANRPGVKQKTGSVVQLQLIEDNGTYTVSEDPDPKTAHTLIAGSEASHRIVGLIAGGQGRYYDTATNTAVPLAAFTLFQQILVAYKGDPVVSDDMYDMYNAFTDADAREMVLWLPTQPDAQLQRFAYKNRASLNIPNTRKVVLTWYRFQRLFVSVAAAADALAIPLINNDSANLKRILETGKFASLAEFTTVASSTKFNSLDNLVEIITHAKVDTAARLIGWINSPKVDTGVRLLVVLRHPKILVPSELDERLKRYSPAEMARWLAKPWVENEAAAVSKLTKINGELPLTRLGSIGSGGTAGQRYTPDVRSSSAGTTYHLSMSFSIVSAHHVRFTGLHVTFRRPTGDEPRVWWSVSSGKVGARSTSGVFGPDSMAMVAEAEALMKSKLTDINCYT